MKGLSMANIQKQAYERLSWEPGFISFRFNCGQMKGNYQSVTWGSEQSHAGVSDLAVLAYGRFMIWIEIKQPKEKHLNSQIKFREEIEAQGGLIFTARTMDELESIIEMIRELNGI
jgi:hypothetical protein